MVERAARVRDRILRNCERRDRDSAVARLPDVAGSR